MKVLFTQQPSCWFSDNIHWQMSLFFLPELVILGARYKVYTLHIKSTRLLYMSNSFLCTAKVCLIHIQKSVHVDLFNLSTQSKMINHYHVVWVWCLSTDYLIKMEIKIAMIKLKEQIIIKEVLYCFLLL